MEIVPFILYKLQPIFNNSGYAGFDWIGIATFVVLFISMGISAVTYIKQFKRPNLRTSINYGYIAKSSDGRYIFDCQRSSWDTEKIGYIKIEAINIGREKIKFSHVKSEFK